MSKILRTLMVALLGTFMVFLSSCDKEDDPINSDFGTITGAVSDDAGEPIADVDVTVSGINEDDVTTTTGGDGKYTIENVSIKAHSVTFSKTGWQTVSVTVSADEFDGNKVATANATMVNASAK